MDEKEGEVGAPGPVDSTSIGLLLLFARIHRLCRES